MLNDLNNDHINNPSIKIIDFGVAKYFGENANNFNLIERCGKSAYMAPEVYHDNTCYDGRKADIWSLGVILFVMLIGTHLFNKPSLNDERFYYLMKKKIGIKILLKHWRRLRLINDDVIDLLDKIFQYESDRIDMKELLNHSFLNINRYCNDDIDDDDDDRKSCDTQDTEDTQDTLSENDFDLHFENDQDDEMKNNDDQQSQNQEEDKMNIDDIPRIPARVKSKVTSISEPDDFINPRIGRDGTFEFGLLENNDDIKQKYQF